ncbi:MAG: ester cyclase [Nocardioidaceae bacterium]
MSVASTESTMRGYMDALLGGGDFSASFSDDVLWTTMETGDEIRGRDAVRDFILEMHTHAFDAAPEVKSVTVGDGMAALEAVFVATHTGEFAGLAPTGAAVRLPYVVVYDVAADQITALRAYLSIAGLVAQIQAASGSTARAATGADATL